MLHVAAVSVIVTTAWYPWRDFLKQRFGGQGGPQLTADFVRLRYLGCFQHPSQPLLLSLPMTCMVAPSASTTVPGPLVVGAAFFGLSKSFVREFARHMSSSRNFHGDVQYRTSWECLRSVTVSQGAGAWTRGCASMAVYGLVWHGLTIRWCFDPPRRAWEGIQRSDPHPDRHSAFNTFGRVAMVHAALGVATTPFRSAFRAVSHDHRAFHHIASAQITDIPRYEFHMLRDVAGHLLRAVRDGRGVALFQGAGKAVVLASPPFAALTTAILLR